MRRRSPTPPSLAVRRPGAAVLSLALLLVPAVPALAVDGVIEINQARALAGSGAGDAPGFPVTLSAAGSYRLTGNLEVDTLDTTAIAVDADDVSIDLNGFVIRNRTPCRPDCGAAGSGVGVDASGRENLAVSNGTIIGMGNAAVLSGDDSQVSRLRVIGNGGAGIVVGDRGSVRDSTVDGAGGVGIQTGSNGGVFASAVAGTGSQGIRMGQGSTVAGSRIQNAGGNGIEIDGKRGSVIGNVVLQSGGIGVMLGDGVVAQNVISASTFTAIYMFGGSGGGVIQGNQLSEGTSGADVVSVPGTVLRGNAFRGNSALAINGSNDDGYEGNVFSGNAGSPQVVAAEQIGPNLCDGNTTCP